MTPSLCYLLWDHLKLFPVVEELGLLSELIVWVARYPFVSAEPFRFIDIYYLLLVTNRCFIFIYIAISWYALVLLYCLLKNPVFLMQDYYAVLGVSKNASKSEIKSGMHVVFCLCYVPLHLINGFPSLLLFSLNLCGCLSRCFYFHIGPYGLTIRTTKWFICLCVAQTVMYLPALPCLCTKPNHWVSEKLARLLFA